MAECFIGRIDRQNTLVCDGVFPVEHDDESPFCWTRLQCTLRRPSEHRYLSLYVGRPDSAARLMAEDPSIETRVIEGWHWYSFDFGSEARDTVELKVDPPVVAPGDSRELGVMLRSVVWHNSSDRHSQIERARANATLNDQEGSEQHSHSMRTRVSL